MERSKLVSVAILVLAVAVALVNGYVTYQLSGDQAILGGSTRDNWSVGGNLSVTGTTSLTGVVTLGACGTATWNPGAVSATTTATTAVTVTGATLGDKPVASLDLSLEGLNLDAYVSSTNTVVLTLSAPDSDAAAINLATSTAEVCLLR